MMLVRRLSDAHARTMRDSCDRSGNVVESANMDMASYVEAWRRRAAEEERAQEDRQARARRVAAELARVLGERYAASRVLLVGSLRRGTFGPRSDIDLAVEGLSPKAAEQANVELAGTGGFEVDVIGLEDAKPHWEGVRISV
jgi:predicted nucleotidyltransferase